MPPRWRHPTTTTPLVLQPRHPLKQGWPRTTFSEHEHVQVLNTLPNKTYVRRTRTQTRTMQFVDARTRTRSQIRTHPNDNKSEREHEHEHAHGRHLCTVYLITLDVCMFPSGYNAQNGTKHSKSTDDPIHGEACSTSSQIELNHSCLWHRWLCMRSYHVRLTVSADWLNVSHMKN